MNRVEFMKKLEELLISIPQEDRKDALEYYENYFDEAGAEREQEVIRELISPEHVAQTILDSMSQDRMNRSMHQESTTDNNTGNSTGNNTESGYYYQDTNEDSDKNGSYHYDRSTVPPTEDKYGPLEITLMVLIAIVAAPFVFSVLGAIFGFIAAAFGMVIGFSIAGVSLIVAAVTAFTSGMVGIGFALIGVALLLLCFVCLLIPLDMWLCKTAFPGVFRWCKKWFYKIFGKGGEAA